MKEEDIISHCTATATQLPTAAAGVSGCLSRTLSELQWWGECPCYYVLITAENDLCDVLTAIRDLVHWKELGLQLGLLYSSLEKIDLEQRGRIDSCKINMLSAWLQQQDNVSQKGVPSWSVLRAALQRMGEHELANRISTNWWWVVTASLPWVMCVVPILQDAVINHSDHDHYYTIPLQLY